MLLAHASVGLISNRIINKEIYKDKNINHIFIFDLLVIIFSILPDFDFFYLIATDNMIYSHHKLITHTPIFWLLIGCFMYLILNAIKNYTQNNIRTFISTYLKQIVLTFLIGTLMHLFADILQSEIMIFYPLSTYGFSIFGNILPDRIYYQILHPLFIIELIIIIISLLLIARTYINSKFISILDKQYNNYIKYSLIITSLLTIFISSYIYHITYNIPIYQRDTNNFISYDIDQDKISDNYDNDIDNNGVDNLLDSRLNKEGLIMNAQSIINSNKITGNTPFKYYIGGIDDVRLIDLIYQNSKLSIYPIINNYYNRDKNNKRIDSNIQYKETLFNYLKDKNLLAQTNYKENLQQGDLIFFYNNNKQYIGLILMNNKIATVLNEDKHLIEHNIDIIDFTKELYLFR